MGDRIILHCDCNSFFASVETVLRPELAKVPMAVAGDPENRHGIILAKNELAKKYDIKTAETIWQAKRKCPDLVLVPPHHELYREYYEKNNAIYLEYTDLVEPFSIDESFLDVTHSLHLFHMTPKELADTLRRRIREENGITISVGVSFCKVFAKLGSDYKKPDATTVIGREDVSKIVYPLPASALLFVGKRSQETLNRYSIRTCQDLANCDREFLVKILGKQGETLWQDINGLDEESVRSFYDRREAKSIGNSMTFPSDLRGEEELAAGIKILADSVATRLRNHGKKCCGIQVGIKDTKFHLKQRQRQLKTPTHLQRDIERIAMELIRENWDMGKPVRLLSVTAYDLVDEGEEPEVVEQLSLFDMPGQQDSAENPNQEAIENTVDEIRKKFGKGSISFGVPKKPIS